MEPIFFYLEVCEFQNKLSDVKLFSVNLKKTYKLCFRGFLLINCIWLLNFEQRNKFELNQVDFIVFKYECILFHPLKSFKFISKRSFTQKILSQKSFCFLRKS